MTRVLLVGLQPEAVDYSDPVLPSGMDAKKIQARIELGLKQMTDRGWQADLCLIQPDATAGPALERRLGATTYDCVVIGAGVRLPPKNLLLFETIVNTVHKAAPNTSIGFKPRLAGYPPANSSLKTARACFPHNASSARGLRSTPSPYTGRQARSCEMSLLV